MDVQTIFFNVVLPSLVTAALLLLAWRPWNRAAQPARWQFILSGMAVSLPWIIAAGNRGNPTLHFSLWIFKPGTGDTARWFLDIAIAIAVFAILLSLLAPRPSTPLKPTAYAMAFSASSFAAIVILGAIIAWLLLRGILARTPLDGDTDAEILILANKQTSARLSILVIPLVAAAWSLVADRLTARGRSVLVPALLSLVALASMIIIIMAGSMTLMLLMAGLAAMMIAATVLARISKPAIFPAGHTAPFFIIWTSILLYTRAYQPQLLPDYFWLLMLTPAGLLVALHPAIGSLRPWLRLPIAAAVTLIPPLIILWQLYPSWQANMANYG